MTLDDPTRLPDMTDEQYESYCMMLSVLDDMIDERSEILEGASDVGRKLADLPD